MLSTETGTEFTLIEFHWVTWEQPVGGRLCCVNLHWLIPSVLLERCSELYDYLFLIVTRTLMDISDIREGELMGWLQSLSTP